MMNRDNSLNPDPDSPVSQTVSCIDDWLCHRRLDSQHRG